MVIREKFIYFLWQQGLFKKQNLLTTDNEAIEVIYPGSLNADSGPDFFNAKVKINGQLWAGNVEIHVKSSDWFVHSHERDVAYNSIILHVVWEDDVPVFTNSNTPVSNLVLKDYVDEKILNNYQKLFFSSKDSIKCATKIKEVANSFLFSNFKERLYFDRLEQKSDLIYKLLAHSNNDWEAVLFKMLAKNFGLKVNGEAFLQMANILDFHIVRKSSNSQLQLEALFFGASNLLEDPIENSYFIQLQKEYTYLSKKFKLTKNLSVKPKFFRLRPQNFPTIRLSQLANLYVLRKQLFAAVMAIHKIDEFYDLFQISVSKFWETHYTFKATSKNSKKKLTKSFIDLLLINTIIPLKLVYLKQHNKLDVSKIIALAREIKPEKNSIVQKFNDLGVVSKTSLEAQAILHLYTNYCKKDACLSCVVGNKILKND